FNLTGGKRPRYYQQIAIKRAVDAILAGEKRLLLTMATGTGKTTVAFQICWKLWTAEWNRTGRVGTPKILFLADRRVLVDDPKDKDFAPFEDARFKITGGVTSKSRDMYFALYQSLAEDEGQTGLFRDYKPDFFDLIIVDECHRGSAQDGSNWRAILDYFTPAVQLGMTATPLRQENRDTYDYFGNPLYTYSLRQGIADGFLAPYSVHRVVTTYDATGWRPAAGEVDRFGVEIPDAEYLTPDFERKIVLRARTEAIAHHLTEHLRTTDRFAKTLVFCVDQEHADTMRQALNNLNADLVQHCPDYVCRVTSDEGDIGRGHLSRFQELETASPVILTTSQMLTTGVDAPMVKNVVLVRVINAMTEFKQIIGRGTRVREDYGKLSFTILDYTGSATRHFADPDFDGEPVRITEEEIDDNGVTVPGTVTVITPEDMTEDGAPGGGTDAPDDITGGDGLTPDPERRRRPKYYVDSSADAAGIAAIVVYELDAHGKRMRIVEYTTIAAEGVRTLYTSPDELRPLWANEQQRRFLIETLAEQGIDLATLLAATGQPDADPFDALCHVAWGAPLRTRRQRAERLRLRHADLFAEYGPKARAILD
ncbi:MAG TPA: DEAD/DEAH box helicase family protein, partial [Thermomicrobiales bacterium]